MTLKEATYVGDSDYNLRCTGDCVHGDEVRFERAVFSGSFRKATFCGFEMITGKIIAESYGAEKQQHTFTIQLLDGSKTKIKGRNLYANGTWRKPWPDECERKRVADEKHARGAEARNARDQRKEERNNFNSVW